METEIKLNAIHLADPLAILEDSWLQRLIRSGSMRQIRMDSRYCDTADNQLAACGWTLRLRQENERSVLTVKGSGHVEAGLHQRQEWSAELGDDEAAAFACLCTGADTVCCLPAADGIPDAVWDEIQKLIRDRSLREIGRVTFTRLTCDLLYDRTQVELALDRGMLSSAGQEAPFCELELELQQGDTADLIALGHDLAGRFNLKPENRSKLARCLTLAADLAAADGPAT